MACSKVGCSEIVQVTSQHPLLSCLHRSMRTCDGVCCVWHAGLGELAELGKSVAVSARLGMRLLYSCLSWEARDFEYSDFLYRHRDLLGVVTPLNVLDCIHQSIGADTSGFVVFAFDMCTGFIHSLGRQPPGHRSCSPVLWTTCAVLLMTAT